MTERIDERLQAMGVDASEMTDEQKERFVKISKKMFKAINE